MSGVFIGIPPFLPFQYNTTKKFGQGTFHSPTAKTPIVQKGHSIIKGRQKGGGLITIKINNQNEFLRFLNFICSEYLHTQNEVELLLNVKADLAIHFPYGEIDYASIEYLSSFVRITLVFKDSRFSALPSKQYMIEYQFEI